jgi:hypothetical protein
MRNLQSHLCAHIDINISYLWLKGILLNLMENVLTTFVLNNVFFSSILEFKSLQIM